VKLKPDARYVGYEHDYYEGDFWCFGFWFFHIVATNDARFYLSEEEIEADIAEFVARQRNVKSVKDQTDGSGE
jgi:hypothetical protein